VQVAGVLTNLAEMYTHLGAAREELELRERVLSIRADDPTADATSIQRLRDRVDELRAMLAAQDPPIESDDIEFDVLPVVRTAEYTSPVALASEPEPVAEEPVVAEELIVAETVTEAVEIRVPTAAIRDEAFRMSPPTSQLSVAPWPGAAATGTTPTSGRTVEPAQPNVMAAQAVAPVTPVEIISVSSQPVTSFVGGMDHGFSDMGRDEMRLPMSRRMGSRSSLYSIAAGLVLVAGLIAARGYVKGPDDASVSAGSVNLAAAAAVRPVVSPAPAPVAPAPEARTVERLIADHRAERDARRAAADSPNGDERNREPTIERAPRIPSAADMERALRSVDGAVKAIDLRTKAATDSATAIRMQAPTFKKVKLADP
jgi:hypothetical protein